MMQVYVSVPRQGVPSQVARELMGDGVAPDRIRIYSARPAREPDPPVPVTRYRSPATAMARGAGAGALIGGLAGLPLLLLGAFGLAPLLVLILAGGLVGALYRQWLGSAPGAEIYRLDRALRRGDTVMVVEVERARVGELERRVKARHPDVAVLGTDPDGTPPFP